MIIVWSFCETFANMREWHLAHCFRINPLCALHHHPVPPWAFHHSPPHPRNPASSQGYLEVSSVEAKALAKAKLIDTDSVWQKRQKIGA